jgi:hypothetical protein
MQSSSGAPSYCACSAACASSSSLDVDVGAAVRRPISRLGFQQRAEFEHVAMNVGMAGQHLHPGIGEVGVEAVGDLRAAAFLRVQQPLGRQLLDRLAQRRPRDTEFRGQLALGRQPVARPQGAFEDALLDLRCDRIGEPRGSLGECRAHGVGLLGLTSIARTGPGASFGLTRTSDLR